MIVYLSLLNNLHHKSYTIFLFFTITIHPFSVFSGVVLPFVYINFSLATQRHTTALARTPFSTFTQRDIGLNSIYSDLTSLSFLLCSAVLSSLEDKDYCWT